MGLPPYPLKNQVLTFNANAGIPYVKEESKEEQPEKINCGNCAGPLTRHLENCEYCRCLNPNFKAVPPPLVLPSYVSKPPIKSKDKPKMTAGILAMTIGGGLIPILLYDQLIRRK